MTKKKEKEKEKENIGSANLGESVHSLRLKEN